MTLAIGWLHEGGETLSPPHGGGSMTLAIGWLHEGGETLGTWLHEGGDWHSWGASSWAVSFWRPCLLASVSLPSSATPRRP